MDPLAALDIINDPDYAPGVRLEALEDLAEWLKKGGFVPTGPPGGPMHSTLTEEATESLQEDAGDLVGAVRVALAYGDHSGLEGLS